MCNKNINLYRNLLLRKLSLGLILACTTLLPLKAQSQEEILYISPKENRFSFNRYETNDQQRDKIININSGLFYANDKDKNYQPCGALKISNSGVFAYPVSEPKQHGGNFEKNNGFFGILQNGKSFIKPYNYKLSPEQNQFELPPPIDINFGFQNGCILIMNGKIYDNYSNFGITPLKRAAIGCTENAKIIYFVSFTPITLQGLAEKMYNLGCENAIFLDANNVFLDLPNQPMLGSEFDPKAFKFCFIQKQK